jgi:hypothetical protein
MKEATTQIPNEKRVNRLGIEKNHTKGKRMHALRRQGIDIVETMNLKKAYNTIN